MSVSLTKFTGGGGGGAGTGGARHGQCLLKWWEAGKKALFQTGKQGVHVSLDLIYKEQHSIPKSDGF